jgi:hypothetical protein
MIRTATSAPGKALAALTLLTALAASPIRAQEPTELTVSPAVPTTEDVLLLRLSGFGCAPQLEPPVRSGEAIAWSGTSVQCIHPVYWRSEARLEPLPAGTYQARAAVDGEVVAQLEFTVRPPSETLLLHGGRFRAVLLWTNPHDGLIRLARAVSVSDFAGYFWFGGPNNPEVALKLLDGRSLNRNYWVMASSLTTLKFDLIVTDIGDGTCLALHALAPTAPAGRSPLVADSHPPNCPERRYHQAPNRNRNFFDFQAFTDPT